jgi:hypothetical protein
MIYELKVSTAKMEYLEESLLAYNTFCTFGLLVAMYCRYL